MEVAIDTCENTQSDGDCCRDEAAQSTHCDYLMPGAVSESISREIKASYEEIGGLCEAQ